MDSAPQPPVPLPADQELHAIARVFYDKVYAHPWIGRFFEGVDQANQELKLVRFFHLSWDDRASMFGQLQGQYLKEEHAHLYITAELFELRQELFAAALRERGHDEAMVRAMLAFNEVWRPYVVKADPRECTDEFTGHAIVEVPPPG